MAYNPLYRGTTSKAPARANQSGYQNGTLADILMAKPVSANASGQIVLADVSNETSVSRFIGISKALIPTGSNGQVVSGGRAEAIGAGLSGFALGDAVYVGKNGTLINVRPDIGVASFVALDWVIFLGVVVKNEFDPGEKDIQLMIEVVGQL